MCLSCEWKKVLQKKDSFTKSFRSFPEKGQNEVKRTKSKFAQSLTGNFNCEKKENKFISHLCSICIKLRKQFFYFKALILSNFIQSLSFKKVRKFP